MSTLKKYNKQNVYDASIERIKFTFDNFEKIYVAYSGGKDSTVMLHMVMQEAIKRNVKVGVLFVDLEAQYNLTIEHTKKLFKEYEDYIDLHWVCLPMSLRNAVSNFEPRWLCWDRNQQEKWVREMPKDFPIKTKEDEYPFFIDGYEFEEFIVEFGKWYSEGKKTACLVGIRTDESLNRFRTIANKKKVRFKNKTYTTLVEENTNLYNVYPIYDWKTSDLWLYHAKNPNYTYNKIYDYMFKAGLTPDQMRLCQPYGDDQKQGLWLYHVLEPETWYKLITRVSGVNSGALYIQESGNISGNRKITKPENHTWESFCYLLLKTLPKQTSLHYIKKFKIFISWWKKRGYPEGIPQETPYVLESKRLTPSWRRLCKVLLRNDYWCKGLCFSQPKSEAYGKYLEIKKRKKKLEKLQKT